MGDIMNYVAGFFLKWTAALCLLCWSLPALAGAELQRPTTAGPIEGTLLADGAIQAWLGVPYAKPPVGALRWRAPQTPEAWTTPLKTQAMAPVSLQMKGKTPVGSEDCLYLNVFRPNDQSANLPVLFFLHGGNNQTGSAAFFDGALIAEKTRSVVVTVNHRLNALGWLNIKAVKTGDPVEDSGNFGLLDIRKALAWVHDNAAFFGGDKTNISVCGFSSGARNALCMVISPLFKNSFHKLITFSGGMTTSTPEDGARIATKALAQLVLEDKKAATEREAIDWLNSATPEVAAYLRNLPAERFAPLMANANIRMGVFPHLFTDGATLPADGFAAVERGQYNKVPMLFTSGADEFTVKANADPYFADTRASLDDPRKEKEYAFATKYGSMLFGYINAERNAMLFSAVKGQPPVFASRFLWGANPLVVGEKAGKLIGGTHGMDICILLEQERPAFKVSDEIFSADNKPGRQAMARLLQGYLGNFMRTGDPNGVGLPRWDPWSNAAGHSGLLFIDADKTTATARMGARIVREQDVFRQMREDDGLSPERKEFIVKHILNGRFFSNNLDMLWR